MPKSSRLTLLPHMNSPRPSRKNVRPMVAISSVRGSWLTSGRSTSRSMP